MGLRIGWAQNGYDIIHVNDPGGSAEQAAHLLELDTIHGRWWQKISFGSDRLNIDGIGVGYSMKSTPAEIQWDKLGVDIVLECSGGFKTIKGLQSHFRNGARKAIVSAPIMDPKVLNVVMGVNDNLYRNAQHDLISGASCATNYLAPTVKVML